MKKIYLILFSALFILQGCDMMEEKGNYDYHAINEIVFEKFVNGEGVNVGETFSAEIGEPLELTPYFSQTMDKDESDLVFYWTMWTQAQAKIDTISHERNLVWHVNVPNGEYNLRFFALNTKTNVYYRKDFIMLVVLDKGGGLYLLNDLNGEANVAIIHKDGTMSQNVYKNANDGQIAGRNPLFIGDARIVQNPDLQNLMILCEDEAGGVAAYSTTRVKEMDIKNSFIVPPATMKPEAYYKSVFPPLYVYHDYLLNDGKLYTRSLQYQTQGKSSFSDGVRLPRFSEYSDYHLSKYAFVTGIAYIFYDNLNYRFWTLEVRDGTITGYLNTISSARRDPKAFDPNDTGVHVYYMNKGNDSNNGSVMQAYAVGRIMEDEHPSGYAKGTGVILCFDAVMPGDSWYSYSITPMTDEAINVVEKANSFAMSKLYPHMFCANDNQLYMVDLYTGTIRNILDVQTLAAGHNIDYVYMRTVMETYYKYDISPEINLVLYLGTSPAGGTGENSSVYEIQLKTDGTFDKVKNVFNNNGRVVSMEYL